MDVGDPIFYTDLVSVLAVLVVLKYLELIT